MPLLDCEIVEPGSPATACVIWLHGLGASGHDFVPLVPELRLPTGMAVRFVFPHAPAIPVTINGGYVMPAWYDILAINIEREIDYRHIMASADAIGALIERETARGIPAERIVLAGFSQGGAVAYQVALSYKKPLAGLLALSTYFATCRTIVPSTANKNLPIHVFHGTQDAMVPLALAQQGIDVLGLLGHQPTYKTYNMAHELCQAEINDISACLQQLLA